MRGANLMTSTDDNSRLIAGIPLENPEADAETLGSDNDIFSDRWKTLQEHADLEWFTIAPPPRRWLLEHPSDKDTIPSRAQGVMPLGKVGILSAPGGAGKTMALVQLALAVASGSEWLDTFRTPNPGNVLLALGEEDLDEVRRRIYDAGRLMCLTDEQRLLAARRIVVLPLAGARISLTDETGAPTPTLEQLRARLSESEWRLIALDPLVRFAGPDAEIDNHAATMFIETLESLAQAPGTPAVIVAHHTNKASRDAEGDAGAAIAARGASALTDGARWVANLEPDRKQPRRVKLTIAKSNYSPMGPALMLERAEGGALRAETKAEAAQREARAAEVRDSARPNSKLTGPDSPITEDDY